MSCLRCPMAVGGLIFNLNENLLHIFCEHVTLFLPRFAISYGDRGNGEANLQHTLRADGWEEILLIPPLEFHILHLHPLPLSLPSSLLYLRPQASTFLQS